MEEAKKRKTLRTINIDQTKIAKSSLSKIRKKYQFSKIYGGFAGHEFNTNFSYSLLYITGLRMRTIRLTEPNLVTHTATTNITANQLIQQRTITAGIMLQGPFQTFWKRQNR